MKQIGMRAVQRWAGMVAFLPASMTTILIRASIRAWVGHRSPVRVPLGRWEKYSGQIGRRGSHLRVPRAWVGRRPSAASDLR